MDQRHAMESRDIELRIARRLRARRIQLDMTQHQLAQQTGVVLQTIAKYETAELTISVIRFLDLCRALEIAPADMLTKLQ